MKSFKTILKEELERKGYKVEVERSLAKKSKSLGVRYNTEAIRIERRAYNLNACGTCKEEHIIIYTNNAIKENEINEIVEELKPKYITHNKLFGNFITLKVYVF